MARLVPAGTSGTRWQDGANPASAGEELAPGFQHRIGFGPVTTGAILVAYSHHGRIRSEAAFAVLAGTAPLQASSGNTVRHRLNRHGDRELNSALDVITKVGMRCDAEIKKYPYYGEGLQLAAIILRAKPIQETRSSRPGSP